MLYIEKKRPSQATQRDLSRVKSLPSWGRVIEGDTKALRQHFDLLDKSLVRSDLLEEQHFLCAYCMRRIQDSNTSIEHYIPLSKCKNTVLDYNNFLGVCDGGSSVIVADRRVLCCDQNKGNTSELTIDPRNATMMRGITYTPEGKLIFVNPSSYDEAMLAKINEDINVTLRLNGILDENGNCIQDTSTQIVKGRKDAWNQADVIIKHLARRNRLTSTALHNEIQRIINASKRMEYAGVIIFRLTRKYTSLCSQGL